MTESYSAYLPPVIHFGCGVRRKADEELANLVSGEQARVFLVASGSVRRSAAGQGLEEIFQKSLLVGEYTHVPHDPPVECVDEILAEARKAGANCFLAIGGGSVMDATKTAAFLAHGTRPVLEYFRGEAKLPLRGMPLVAMPTTAGTGAEITKNAVLTDTGRDYKGSIKSPGMVPAVAIVDPEFTFGLPPKVTADSGMDALTQAVESYVSRGANTLTRALAVKSVAALLQWLPVAYREPENTEARLRVAEASMLDAMAFSQSGLGAVHGLAHPIGHRYGLAHGFTCAVLLVPVIRFNMSQTEGAPYQALAKELGLGTAEAFAEAVEKVRDSVGIPPCFDVLREDAFPYILKNCRSGSMKANPHAMSDAEVLDLLAQVSSCK